MAEFIKTKHKVLEIKREDNPYKKYLKWVLKTIIVGINEEEDAKLIPYKEREIIKNWFKTRKQAEYLANFFNSF